jgi:integrase
MTGFPARTASFPTRRQAGRWGKTIEADMIEGKHFRSAEARRRSVAARKEWHWMGHNPFDGVSRFSEGEGSVRFLSVDERERLLAETAKDPQLHVFTILALATASRAGELWKLIWADVDLREGPLLLRKTKNAEPRSAWVHGEALRLLREHRDLRLSEDSVFVSVTGKQYRYDKPFAARVRRRTSRISPSMDCADIARRPTWPRRMRGRWSRK